MTTKLIIIPIPLLVAVLLAVAAPVLIPQLPPFHINLPAAPATEDWEKNLGLYDMAAHSDPDHDPYGGDTVAAAIVEDIHLNWPGGPNNDWLCATIKLAEKVVRTVYWHKTHEGGIGDLAWFNNLTGQWGGAYGYKTVETVTRLPRNLVGKGYSIQSGCGGGPPPFTPAH